MKLSISKHDLIKLQKSHQQVLIVDVRGEEEYKTKHVPDAINIPVEAIEAKQYKLPEQTVVITVCGKGGGRSEKAAIALRENHFQAFYLEGGTNDWFQS